MGKEFFHALFDLAADSMLILDLDGCIKDINPIAYGRLGYTKADMVGKQISSFILPEYVAKLDNRFAKVQQDGYLVYESAQVRRDGSVLPVEISSRAIELDGEAAVFSVVRDITERKQIEMHLRESEEKWRQLFVNMTTGFALHEVTAMNKAGSLITAFLKSTLPMNA